MMYVLQLSAALLLVQAAFSLKFMIKHRLSGKFVHPLNSMATTIPEDDPLVVWDGHHKHMHMTFDIIDGEWGYIRHVESGKMFRPNSGPRDPSDQTKVVLHSDRAPWAYFAFDQVNNHIIHRNGKPIHPFGGTHYPDNGTPLVLHSGAHTRMEFILVSTTWPYKEVFPYGKPRISGRWKLVFSVRYPLATHSQTYQTKIGISKTESTTSSFKFVWETERGGQYYFTEWSTSENLTTEIQKSSSETWYSEITKTVSVEVVAGVTVAVWQKTFIGEQLGHKCVHQSNIFAHTNDPNVNPDGYNTPRIQYRFI